MVQVIRESCKDGHIEITFIYEKNNQDDIMLVEEFGRLCKTQKKCTNCTNFYHETTVGDYQTSSCKLYGCLEVWNHPHHDMDGSKCDSYECKM